MHLAEAYPALESTLVSFLLGLATPPRPTRPTAADAARNAEEVAASKYKENGVGLGFKIPKKRRLALTLQRHARRGRVKGYGLG